MKIAGETLEGSHIVKVYECEWCGYRSRDKERVSRNEIECNHKEEAQAGII
jgi:hypothetical protein